MYIHIYVYIYICMYTSICTYMPNPSPQLYIIIITALGTLESMHEVLSSRGLDDLLPTQGLAFENSNRQRAGIYMHVYYSYISINMHF
jgi:hypothetical protein